MVDVTRLLQKIGLLGCMHVCFMATVWIFRFKNLQAALLPFLGGDFLREHQFLLTPPAQSDIEFCIQHSTHN